MNKFIYAFITALFITMAVTAYSGEIESDLQKNIVRLHIIANSDSEADQTVKLKIRDAIISEEQKKLSSQNLVEDVENIEQNLSQFENIANEILAQNNFAYTSHAVYGIFDFPKKEYKNIVLPSGKYNSVRIILGDGKGKNWWCVIYPPVCMMNEYEASLSKKSEKILRQSLKPETYDIITNSNGKVVVKFRIVEAVAELKKLFSK